MPSGLYLLIFSATSDVSFHNNFKDFVEFIRRKSLDIFGAGVEIASDMGEDGEVGIDGSGIAFEHFKVDFTAWYAKTDSFIIGNGMVKDCLNTVTLAVVEKIHLFPLALIVEFDVFHHHIGRSMSCDSANIL